MLLIGRGFALVAALLMLFGVTLGVVNGADWPTLVLFGAAAAAYAAAAFLPARILGKRASSARGKERKGAGRVLALLGVLLLIPVAILQAINGDEMMALVAAGIAAAAPAGVLLGTGHNGSQN